MDLTAPKVAEVEHLDAPETIDKAVTELATLIKRSKHFIVFTGAGVSTSAGVPDFRGPNGAWTLRAQGKELDFDSTSTLRTVPSPTHMALVGLQDRGILKFLVSQNCDGLHRRSGILPDRIAELHGNSNLEHCQKCQKEYLRDFRALSSGSKSLKDHRTGRKCAICGGALLDTIINFGEDLPEHAFDLALTHAKRADLCLVLGSSLRVTPADSIPYLVGKKKGSKLAICNLQATPQDDIASLRVHAKVDDIMIRVMQKLDLTIPPFILRRKITIQVEGQDDRHQVKVAGIEVDGTPSSFLKSVALKGDRRAAKSEPFLIAVREKLGPALNLELELEFMGHYGEPNMVLRHRYSGNNDRQYMYKLDYDPQTHVWTTIQDGHT